MLRLARQIGRLSCLLALVTGCGHLVYADGPYHGRVLDAETKQPIEGAAVLAVWWKRSPGPGHPIISFYDAQEVVTSATGTFTIPGIFGGSFNPLAKIEDPLFTIFKPGYEAYGNRRLVLPDATRSAVLQLRALFTREERMRNVDRTHIERFCLSGEGSDHCIPRDTAPALIRLRDIELRLLRSR